MCIFTKTTNKIKNQVNYKQFYKCVIPQRQTLQFDSVIEFLDVRTHELGVK